MRIVVNESSRREVAGDVFVLPSEEDASGYLEAIDVENNEYFCLSEFGHPVVLSTNRDAVIIKVMTDAEIEETLLRDWLVQTVSALPRRPLLVDPASLDTPFLLRMLDRRG